MTHKKLVLTNVKVVVFRNKSLKTPYGDDILEKVDNYYKAINWNEIEDTIDKATWEKLTEQFWLDTRIPLSNDLDDWRTLKPEEKTVVGHVFGGLTLLDTLQSQDGMAKLKENVRTQKEEAVLNNIQFMESVHAKSYSSIFSTLNTNEEIKEIFNWTDHNEYLQKKKQNTLMISIKMAHLFKRKWLVFFLKLSYSTLDSTHHFTTWVTTS